MCIIYRSSSDESDIVYVVGGVGCISEDVVEEATYKGIGAKEKTKGHVLTLITGGVTVRLLLPLTGSGWIRGS